MIAKEKKLLNIVLMIGIGILGFIFGYINLMQYKVGLNADVASEGLLAREIWESKEWIPKDWYFSSETRIISVSTLAALCFGITKNICLSMGISCILVMVFILICLYILCKELEFNFQQTLCTILLVFLLPNSKNQLELTFLFAGYYAFHVANYFLTLAFYMKLLKGETVKWITLGILCLIHFIQGAQGMRGILMITGPLLAVEAVRRIYLLYCRQGWKKEDNKITGFAVGVNLVSFLGSKLSVSVGYPLSRNIRKAPQKFAEIVMPDFFASMDWENLSNLEKAAYGCGLLFVLILVIYIFLKGLKKQQIKNVEWVYLNFAASVFLTVSALTFTTVDSSSRYFIAIFFVMAVGMAILWNMDRKIIKLSILTIVVIIFCKNYDRVYQPLLEDKNYKRSEYAKISEYLIQEEYENAYTNFDHANIITLIGDEKVQVSAVSSLSNMEANKWLSCKKWYVPNVSKESKTAYIVSESREAEFNEFLQKYHNTIEFKTKIGRFNIYGSEYNYSTLVE